MASLIVVARPCRHPDGWESLDSRMELNMTRGNIGVALLVGGALGLTAVAHANYAFDNFTGPSLGYNVDTGWSVCGQSNGGWSGKTPGHASEQLADEFTAALGGTQIG